MGDQRDSMGFFLDASPSVHPKRRGRGNRWWRRIVRTKNFLLFPVGLVAIVLLAVAFLFSPDSEQAPRNEAASVTTATLATKTGGPAKNKIDKLLTTAGGFEELSGFETEAPATTRAPPTEAPPFAKSPPSKAPTSKSPPSKDSGSSVANGKSATPRPSEGKMAPSDKAQQVEPPGPDPAAEHIASRPGDGSIFDEEYSDPITTYSQTGSHAVIYDHLFNPPASSYAWERLWPGTAERELTISGAYLLSQRSPASERAFLQPPDPEVALTRRRGIRQTGPPGPSGGPLHDPRGASVVVVMQYVRQTWFERMLQVAEYFSWAQEHLDAERLRDMQHLGRADHASREPVAGGRRRSPPGAWDSTGNTPPPGFVLGCRVRVAVPSGGTVTLLAEARLSLLGQPQPAHIYRVGLVFCALSRQQADTLAGLASAAASDTGPGPRVSPWPADGVRVDLLALMPRGTHRLLELLEAGDLPEPEPARARRRRGDHADKLESSGAPSESDPDSHPHEEEDSDGEEDGESAGLRLLAEARTPEGHVRLVDGLEVRAPAFDPPAAAASAELHQWLDALDRSLDLGPGESPTSVPPAPAFVPVAACLGPVYAGDRVGRRPLARHYIEWLEYHRMVGVRQVHAYVADTGDQNVADVLDFYARWPSVPAGELLPAGSSPPGQDPSLTGAWPGLPPGDSWPWNWSPEVDGPARGKEATRQGAAAAADRQREFRPLVVLHDWRHQRVLGQGRVAYYGQRVLLNDCLYQAGDSYALLVHMDVDEFLEPSSATLGPGPAPPGQGITLRPSLWTLFRSQVQSLHARLQSTGPGEDTATGPSRQALAMLKSLSFRNRFVSECEPELSEVERRRLADYFRAVATAEEGAATSSGQKDHGPTPPALRPSITPSTQAALRSLAFPYLEDPPADPRQRTKAMLLTARVMETQIHGLSSGRNAPHELDLPLDQGFMRHFGHDRASVGPGRRVVGGGRESFAGDPAVCRRLIDEARIRREGALADTFGRELRRRVSLVTRLIEQTYRWPVSEEGHPGVLPSDEDGLGRRRRR
ncbi:hypothetical protein H696_02915 [Fonticula alba]|uniref:Glycosyltransferase family 92 protein n=1 Tax=Fonticula alba TaxID=691883 RepID=A0A058Z8J9_FONAL|nr:hypothetical protein H696_02915 [Fonticula alba]KCV70570.1 hypothetical protein H696_02915 [Fonticula alba]|eukprot:XP_009495086.1 hypothetical protein H696_02915 [Fonticula alba]